MNHGQSMNAIAQIAHLLGETTPRMYLCQVRDDTGQCSVCRHIPSSLLSQKNDVANYWVCGILSKLTHVFGQCERFFEVVFAERLIPSFLTPFPPFFFFSTGI